MQTFDFKKTQLVPPHCLWVSGLLLLSGSRAGAGLPRLHRAWHPAGNRLAMGDRAPGAWGAPGADPMQQVAAGLASLWAGGTGEGAGTVQLSVERVSLAAPEFLLCGEVALQGAQIREGNIAGSTPIVDAATISARDGTASDGALISSGEIPALHEESADSTQHDDSCKKRVMFIPKPNPWNGTYVGGGKNLDGARPASFCRKVVTFTPTPNPAG